LHSSLDVSRSHNDRGVIEYSAVNPDLLSEPSERIAVALDLECGQRPVYHDEIGAHETRAKTKFIDDESALVSRVGVGKSRPKLAPDLRIFHGVSTFASFLLVSEVASDVRSPIAGGTSLMGSAVGRRSVARTWSKARFRPGSASRPGQGSIDVIA